MEIRITTSEINEISVEEYEVFSCEYSDIYIKKKFFEVKDMLGKVFKLFVRYLIPSVKKKDENVKKILDEIVTHQKDYIINRNLLTKLILIRQTDSYKNINFEFTSNEEKKEFFEILKIRKELYDQYLKNVSELEFFLNNIREAIETVYLSNNMNKIE